MIYKDLKKAQQIYDVQQVANEVQHYQTYFKVEKGDVVVDIGSHVGMFLRDFLDVASVIVAVEPDPLFIKELEKIECDNLRIIEAGIGEYTGTSLIKSDGSANVVGSGDTEIKLIDFKELLNQANLQRIDFLKIDCEGGEYSILTEEYLPWIKENVKYIAGELHIHSPEQIAQVPLIVELFEKYGFKYKFTTVDRVFLSTEQLLSNLDYYNEVNFFIVPNGEFPKAEQRVTINYVNGCRAEMTNFEAGIYTINMINQDNDKVMFVTDVVVEPEKEDLIYWTHCHLRYFIPWRVEITKQGEGVIYSKDFNIQGQRVLIDMTSRSIGDTIAWLPYAEEFGLKHDCKVIVSTFHNELFEATYPNLEFIPVGGVATNIVAQYNVGWFYAEKSLDHASHPVDPRKQQMQKTASDILGLEFKELKARLNYVDSPRPVISNKYVCIGGWSTAKAKQWNNPEGWQKVVDNLIANGYVVVWLSKEGEEYMGETAPQGVIIPEEYTYQSTMNYLHHCRFFIGVGSGLSWMAWAMGKPVAMISGFSEGYTEMQDNTVRITAPDDKCKGCFNMYRLKADDWEWCPELKNTPRQFECTKSITGEYVIGQIKQLMR